MHNGLLQDFVNPADYQGWLRIVLFASPGKGRSRSESAVSYTTLRKWISAAFAACFIICGHVCHAMRGSAARLLHEAG